MSSYKNIEVAISDNIATVTINRPQARNALNKSAINELTSVFTSDLSTTTGLRCVLLRGSGTEAFCAGADLQELQATSSPDARREFFTAIANLIRSIEQCSTPVVSLIYGFALAGGLGLVAASDIAIAADDAVFGLPEVAVGLAPLVVTDPLVKSVTARGLAHLALSGERISAAEALRIGLITRVVPKESALSEANSLCATIARRAPEAVRATKLALADARQNKSNNFIYELADRSALVSLSDEATEGIKAFSDKRAPSWTKR